MRTRRVTCNKLGMCLERGRSSQTLSVHQQKLKLLELQKSIEIASMCTKVFAWLSPGFLPSAVSFGR